MCCRDVLFLHRCVVAAMCCCCRDELLQRCVVVVAEMCCCSDVLLQRCVVVVGMSCCAVSPSLSTVCWARRVCCRCCKGTRCHCKVPPFSLRPPHSQVGCSVLMCVLAVGRYCRPPQYSRHFSIKVTLAIQKYFCINKVLVFVLAMGSPCWSGHLSQRDHSVYILVYIIYNKFCVTRVKFLEVSYHMGDSLPVGDRNRLE